MAKQEQMNAKDARAKGIPYCGPKVDGKRPEISKTCWMGRGPVRNPDRYPGPALVHHFESNEEQKKVVAATSGASTAKDPGDSRPTSERKTKTPTTDGKKSGGTTTNTTKGGSSTAAAETAAKAKVSTDKTAKDGRLSSSRSNSKDTRKTADGGNKAGPGQKIRIEIANLTDDWSDTEYFAEIQIDGQVVGTSNVNPASGGGTAVVYASVNSDVDLSFGYAVVIKDSNLNMNFKSSWTVGHTGEPLYDFTIDPHEAISTTVVTSDDVANGKAKGCIDKVLELNIEHQ